MFQVDFYVQVIYRNAYKFHFQVGGEIVIYAFEQQTSYGFAGNFSPLPQDLAKENSNHKKVPLTRKQPGKRLQRQTFSLFEWDKIRHDLFD